MKSFSIALLAGLLAVASPLGTWAQEAPQSPASPAATAEPASATASPAAAPTVAPSEPAATPEPRGKRRRHGAVPSAASSAAPSPEPTPTSPAFATLDGHWEVVVQEPSTDLYSSFELHQESDTLSGVWTQSNGKKLPLAGNYDGQHIKLIAQDDTRQITLSGYVENASDIVGIVEGGLPESSPSAAPSIAPSPTASAAPSPSPTPIAFTAVHQAPKVHHSNLLPDRHEKREKHAQS